MSTQSFNVYSWQFSQVANPADPTSPVIRLTLGIKGPGITPATSFVRAGAGRFGPSAGVRAQISANLKVFLGFFLIVERELCQSGNQESYGSQGA